MAKINGGAKIGAAALMLGVGLAGPHVMGIAAAETTDGASVTSADTARDQQRVPSRRGSGSGRPGNTSGASADVSEGISGGDASVANDRAVGSSARRSLGDLGSQLPDREASQNGRVERQAVRDGVMASVESLPQVAASIDQNNEASAAVVSSIVKNTLSEEPSSLIVSLPSSVNALAAATGSEVAVAAKTVAVAPPMNTVEAAINNIFDSVAQFLSTLPGGFITEWLQAGLQLFRRTFFNAAPTVNPVRYAQTEAGQVIGTLGAADREGDDLVYTVTETPMHGQVDIKADGTYVYTPDPALLASGGTDTFAVAVVDSGLHVNLADPLRSGHAEVPVQVVVNASPPVSGSYTERFTIRNLTSKTLTYSETISGAVDSGPAVGTEIVPGQSVAFEIAQDWWSGNTTEAKFTSAEGDEFVVGMHVPGLIAGHPLVPTGTCSANNGNTCSESVGRNGEVELMDPVGTLIVVPASNAQEQAMWLNKLCSGVATCDVNITKRIEGSLYSEMRAVSDPTYNRFGKHDIVLDYTEEDGFERTSSVELSLTVATTLNPIISAEFTATYGESLTNSHSFSQTVHITIPVGYEATVWAAQPVTRVYGDWTVRAGNTTWLLEDVYFDYPDPKRNGRWETHVLPISESAV